MNELNQYKRVHFVGIGGAGMSAIAWILLQRGFQVSGSDLTGNVLTRKLAENGAHIDIGHAAANIADADLVVTSTAIDSFNPERRAALESGIPLWRRAKVLAEIMRGGRSIAISGTHGKTTTTSMVGLILSRAGMDPTVLIGGELNDFGGNARIGAGEWVVAEADESDGSLLEMNPDRIIVTNIEADHLDFYKDIDAIIATFDQFLSQMRPGGKLIACLDDPAAAALAQRAQKISSESCITYSMKNPEADIRAELRDSLVGSRGVRFEVIWHGENLGEIQLQVPGRHNVLNALAATAVALDLGAQFDSIKNALETFHGAKRRFQVKGNAAGVTVVDDYAHHPTEISATLAAAREQQARSASDTGGRSGRVVAIFQPHRYSRTQALAGDFGRALCASDMAIITDVYSAGEAPIEGVSGRMIYDQAILSGHLHASYQPTLDEARAFAAGHLMAGDMLLTVGAGNVYKLGEALLEDLAGPKASIPA